MISFGMKFSFTLFCLFCCVCTFGAETNRVNVSTESPIQFIGTTCFQQIPEEIPFGFTFCMNEAEEEKPFSYLLDDKCKIEPECGVEIKNNFYMFLEIGTEREFSFVEREYSFLYEPTINPEINSVYFAFHPKYCSTMYGIMNEMKDYEKMGLPIPKELQDKMNVAIELYLFMELFGKQRHKSRTKLIGHR